MLASSIYSRIVGVVLTLLASGCRSRAPSLDASAEPVSGESAAPSATPPPAPRAVRLGDPPDVRVTLPSTVTARVTVGQTFGILVPPPADWLDEWELEPPCPLGEPLTFITRENGIGRELLFGIGDAQVGTHVVRLRLMHRATRESTPVPSKHTEVRVEVLRSP